MKKDKKPFKINYSFKEFSLDFLFDVLGSIAYAIGIYTFAAAANFAPGGIAGVSIIINHYFKWLPLGVCQRLFDILIIPLCLTALGKRFFFKSLKTLIISTLVLDLLIPLFPQYNAAEPLLAALFAGVLSGLGLALIYSRGSSTGGTDFIIFALKKKFPHLSVGTITIVTDGTVILLGGLVFKKVEAVLYGITMTAAATIIMDKLMYGFDSSKLTLIVTDKSADIAARISTELERGSTIVKATGAYTGADKQILFCTCSKSEAYEVRRIVYSTDRDAFIMTSTVDAAYGYGFKALDE